MRTIKPKPRCTCGHTQGQHFRVKYTQDRGHVEDGCSRCICPYFLLKVKPDG